MMVDEGAAAARGAADSGADSLADARDRGRLRATGFEETLRRRESEQREELLVRQSWSPGGGDSRSNAADAAKMQRLQAEVDHFRGFHDAVVSSRPWRLIQAARRLLGRAW